MLHQERDHGAVTDGCGTPIIGPSGEEQGMLQIASPSDLAAVFKQAPVAKGAEKGVVERSGARQVICSDHGISNHCPSSSVGFTKPAFSHDVVLPLLRAP